MASVAQIDETLSSEEANPLTAEEQPFADAAMAGLTPSQREKIQPIDLITVVRGYRTYEPRLEETNKALKVCFFLCVCVCVCVLAHPIPYSFLNYLPN